MFSIEILPGFVLGIREGLEAFLVIAIMLEYLNKSNRQHDKKYVIQGLLIGLIISIVFGTLLFVASNLVQSGESSLSKLWEVIASLIALGLITTFLVFTLKNSETISDEIKGKMSIRLTKRAIISLAAVMVAREGAEVVLFVIASVDQTLYSIGAIIGVLFSGILAYLIYKSLFKINLKVLFNITILYLILQAGFLLGYSFHELISYFSAEQMISSNHWIFNQLFNLSGTLLDHKTQPVGIALYALVGWYSKPELLQFIIQYVYTGVFLFWFIKINIQKSLT